MLLNKNQFLTSVHEVCVVHAIYQQVMCAVQSSAIFLWTSPIKASQTNLFSARTFFQHLRYLQNMLDVLLYELFFSFLVCLLQMNTMKIEAATMFNHCK